MKLIRTATLALIASTLLFSCKHDVPEPMVRPDNYSNLKAGNYWIYQIYDVDPSNYGTPTANYDSCYVEKDSVINGITYHKYVAQSSVTSPAKQAVFLRDSLTYLVNTQGYIRFCSTDFTSAFYPYYAPGPAGDTIYEMVSQMFNETSPAIVPAGSFAVLNFKTTYTIHPPYNAVAGEHRYRHARYAKDIGLILETLPFYLSISTMQERRLVRYHLE